MSEKQAKIKRKEENVEVNKKPKDKGKIIFYIISSIVIIAFAALAGYAVGGKMSKSDLQLPEQADSSQTADTSTLGGIAESKGMTFEELAEKAGLDTSVYSADTLTADVNETLTVQNVAMIDYDLSYEEFAANNNIDTSVITADMLYKDAVQLFTVENAALMNYGVSFEEFAAQYGIDTSLITADMLYTEATDLFTLDNVAAFSGMDGETLKTNAGLDESVDTTVPMKDLPVSAMMTFNGISVSLDDLKEYGLSEKITADTKWGNAEEEIEKAYEAYIAASAEADGGAQ